MILRCAAKTAMAMCGMAFLTGLGLGAAAVAGGMAARGAMQRRRSWRDDAGGSDTLPPSSDAMMPSAPPL